MDLNWLKSATSQRIFAHFADSRPAWLWSGDGSRLLWRNASARLFGAKVKKSGLRVMPDPVPIKGQVARLIRLGAPARSSLSRIQFLAGERPVAATCSVTPLPFEDGRLALLVVAIDPVDPALRDAADAPDPDSFPAALFPPGVDHLLIDREGAPAGGSIALDVAERAVASGTPPEGVRFDGFEVVARLAASPEGHHLLLLTEAAAEAGAEVEAVAPPAPTIDEVRAEEGVGKSEEAGPNPTTVEEPLGGAWAAPPAAEAGEPSDAAGTPAPASDADVEEATDAVSLSSLSSLFDRLAGTETLYGELTERDEVFVPPAPTTPPGEAEEASAPPQGEPDESGAGTDMAAAGGEPMTTSPEPPEILKAPEDDMIGQIIAFDDDARDATSRADELPGEPDQYLVTGRGFTPLPEDGQAEGGAEATTPPPDSAPDIESVERVSRYNFDELSRILSDRVGREGGPADDGAPADPNEADRAAFREPPRQGSALDGALVNIAAETFILNRLPLGIMVFRDQQVLFANRALADLLGHPTIDSLRASGLDAVFPSDESQAGPVTHLVHRDGTPFPVTAKLQTITWQGRSALLLSAAPLPPVMSHEGAVRAFAERAAELMGDGFITTDRAGNVVSLSATARGQLGPAEDAREGMLLASLVRPDDLTALREFLEQPARFAETARPAIRLRTREMGVDLALFAEGQAGLVSGYFGFVLAAGAEAAGGGPTPAAELDPTMLARISRGVRRPLNTIIGFADLIRSAAFGAIENHRYVEYARDIRTAGQEIAVLVDELDDYGRLRAGSYPTRPAELDLAGLLESCALRVRGQAGAARVLVRSAISERLPRVRADRASLGQALLNLLASAIDQSPPGSSVILSAQLEEEGHVAVNIRDSGEALTDPGERFVVFRDGIGKDGEPLAPVRSSVGLALTRSLVAVNACKLAVGPAGAVGTLFALTIPADLVAVSATG